MPPVELAAFSRAFPDCSELIEQCIWGKAAIVERRRRRCECSERKRVRRPLSHLLSFSDSALLSDLSFNFCHTVWSIGDDPRSTSWRLRRLQRMVARIPELDINVGVPPNEHMTPLCIAARAGSYQVWEKSQKN